MRKWSRLYFHFKITLSHHLTNFKRKKIIFKKIMQASKQANKKKEPVKTLKYFAVIIKNKMARENNL